MFVKDFDYELPQELIAQHPMEPRDHSRLMVVNKHTGEIEHKHFYDLLDYLEPGDLLVFNDTRVIPARLFGFKDTGAHVEVFLLARKNATDWEALVRPGKKLQVGAKIKFSEDLSAEVIDYTDFGGRIVRFEYEGIFEEILDRLGETPLPPYITAPLEDKERYQTVYSRERGSAAAPTAGLHFTKELLQKIKDKGCEEVFVTLHVGLGTFRPVKADRIDEHIMHTEYFSVSKESAEIINTIVSFVLKETNGVIFNNTTSEISNIKCNSKSKKVNYTLNVDREVRNVNLSLLKDRPILNICKILGVFLDNSIEAVKDLKEKQITIEISLPLFKFFAVFGLQSGKRLVY